MEHYVGLDVSQRITHVCVIDAEAHIIWRGKYASTPEAIADTVKAFPPNAQRVGLKTGPLSIWHYHGFKEFGVPVVCIDARHAHAAQSMQINRTDKNDARGIASYGRNLVTARIGKAAYLEVA